MQWKQKVQVVSLESKRESLNYKSGSGAAAPVSENQGEKEEDLDLEVKASVEERTGE